MNVNPCRAHDSHVVTIHRVGRDGKTGTAAERLPRAALGAWRAQIAMNVLERRGVAALCQNNANLQGEMHRDLGRLTRQAALADRRVQICDWVETRGAWISYAGAPPFVIGSVCAGLAEAGIFWNATSQAAGALIGGAAGSVFLGGVVMGGAKLARCLSDRQQAQVQTELDRLLVRSAALQEEAIELVQRDSDLLRADHELVRNITRYRVAQWTDMAAVIANLVIDYLPDADPPTPGPLPAPTGS